MNWCHEQDIYQCLTLNSNCPRNPACWIASSDWDVFIFQQILQRIKTTIICHEAINFISFMIHYTEMNWAVKWCFCEKFPISSSLKICRFNFRSYVLKTVSTKLSTECNKIGTANAICWNSLGLFRDCSLNFIFFRIKTYLFFEHLWKKSSWNLAKFQTTNTKYRNENCLNDENSQNSFFFKRMLKVSAFYLEKQKSFIPEKYNLGRSLYKSRPRWFQ